MNYNNIQMIYKAKDLTIKSNDKEYHFDELVKSNINEFLGKYNPFDMNLNKISNRKYRKFDKNSQYEDLKVGMYYVCCSDIKYFVKDSYEVYYVAHKTKSYIKLITYDYEKTRIINTQSFYDREKVSEDKWKYSKAKGDKKLYITDDAIPLYRLYEYTKEQIDDFLKNNISYSCVELRTNINPFVIDIERLMRENKRNYREYFSIIRNNWTDFNFGNCGAVYRGLLIQSDNETQNLMNYYELMKIMDMFMIGGMYKKELKMAKELLAYEFNKNGRFYYRHRINADEVSSIIEKYL
jgi:hypothetical protein